MRRLWLIFSALVQPVLKYWLTGPITCLGTLEEGKMSCRYLTDFICALMVHLLHYTYTLNYSLLCV